MLVNLELLWLQTPCATETAIRLINFTGTTHALPPVPMELSSLIQMSIAQHALLIVKRARKMLRIV